MNHIPLREQINPIQVIGRLTGQSIKAAAIVCSDGVEEMTTVTAFISPREASPNFRHAIDMEHSYGKTLLAFDEVEPPFYGNTSSIDLKHVASAIGVDRVLCVVSMTAEGVVSGVRDYDGVEVTVLEAATEQMTGFQDLLLSLSHPYGQSRLQ